MLTDLMKKTDNLKAVHIGNMWKSSSLQYCDGCNHMFKEQIPFYYVVLECHSEEYNKEYKVCQACNNVTIAGK